VLETLEKEGLLWLNPDKVQQALLAVRWPGRLEVLEESPMILLDGAHNPQGAEALRAALKSSFSYRKLHLVIGIMGDKDIKGILRRLLPIAETAIFTQPRYSRAAKAEDLRKLARPYIKKHYVIPDLATALEQARAIAAPQDLICITGSLYFAGEVKELLGEPTLQ
jgi:dihydrofolate synthase/folylpolyglutamate synthase